MAAELGIGVRVFVHWSPDPENLRATVGVIVDGPHNPGEVHRDTRNPLAEYIIHERGWKVESSADPGARWLVPERMLSPFDDDNNQSTRHERELVEE